MRAPECFGTLMETFGTLEGDIDDRTLLDALAAIFPAERDMHDKIEHPEALAALWRSPRYNETGARNDAVDEIVRLGSRPQVFERNEAIWILFAGLLLRRVVAGFDCFKRYDDIVLWNVASGLAAGRGSAEKLVRLLLRHIADLFV